MWFQVKGATNVGRLSGGRTVTFDMPSRLDMCSDGCVAPILYLVVLWDVATDSGYSAMPMAQINAWERGLWRHRVGRRSCFTRLSLTLTSMM